MFWKKPAPPKEFDYVFGPVGLDSKGKRLWLRLKDGRTVTLNGSDIRSIKHIWKETRGVRYANVFDVETHSLDDPFFSIQVTPPVGNRFKSGPESEEVARLFARIRMVFDLDDV